MKRQRHEDTLHARKNHPKGLNRVGIDGERINFSERIADGFPGEGEVIIKGFAGGLNKQQGERRGLYHKGQRRSSR